MPVQCMDALPISLLSVCTPQSRGTKSQLVKFARAAKKDHAELESHLMNEKTAYDKLVPLRWWEVPRCIHGMADGHLFFLMRVHP